MDINICLFWKMTKCPVGYYTLTRAEKSKVVHADCLDSFALNAVRQIDGTAQGKYLHSFFFLPDLLLCNHKDEQSLCLCSKHFLLRVLYAQSFLECSAAKNLLKRGWQHNFPSPKRSTTNARKIEPWFVFVCLGAEISSSDFQMSLPCSTCSTC